jgi:pimeloyl-ACP methyl ester carboxylesterase
MIFYKLLKKPFFGKFMVQWRNPLSAEAQKDWERFSVKSKSGSLLQALFAKPFTGSAKATIVLAHPMGKEAKGYFLKNGHTNLLRSNGYNVIVFDINGFGESSIANFGFEDDIVAISIKAKTFAPHLPLGYHGISLGGQMSTIAFTNENHLYDFAIVESAATSLDEFWVMFPAANRMLKILNIFLPRYKKKIHMVERIKDVKHLQSILFIYSHTDTWTPVQMGERFRNNCPVPSELFTVAKAEHAQIMKSEHREGYENKIVAYFDEATKNYSLK